MRLRLLRLLILSLFCVVIFSYTAQAQWAPGGVPIAYGDADENQGRITSDGAGGAIIAWRDYRGTRTAIYVQRIDAMGNALWQVNGVFLASSMNPQGGPKLVPDGAGGAIIVWSENIDATNTDIYAQRIDANGNTLWGANGVAVSTAPGFQYGLELVPDGAGGAIAAWQDKRNGIDFDIYAQRIDTNGSMLWTANGVAISAATGGQTWAKLTPDGVGGAVITWGDSRSGTADIYAQRVDAGGNTLWTADGIVVVLSPFAQSSPGIVSDGSSGAIISWEDMKNGNRDIYARRVNSLGDTLWPAGGTAICTDVDWQGFLKMVSDGAGGAVITWEDDRNGVDTDIYAQRVDANGNVLWTTGGVAIVTAVNNQYLGDITSDGAAGAIIAWDDYRDQFNWYYHIYVQRVGANGNTLWSLDGELVTPSDSEQELPYITSDDAGGAIVTWIDWRSSQSQTYSDIYAQRIEGRHGKWGIPPPYIYSVEDVPADQGGKASVSWLASPLDVYNEQIVSHYSAWRAIKSIPVNSPPLDDITLVDLSIIDKHFQGPAHRFERTSTGNYFWEWVGNTNAYYFEGYSFAAPTLFDSTGANPGWHYFQVVAHGQTQYEFWASHPDSGYSVDNLSPSAPQGLAGDYSYASGKLTLEWKPNTEADLSHYAAYRGAGVDFIPSDLNRIATSTDTIVTDLPYPPEQPYYIKLSALDIHGNESAFAVLPPESITTPTMVTGFESAWRGGYVQVSWVMSDVSQALDFMIERKQGPDGAYNALTPEITLEGHSASFRDNSVTPGNTYTYRVSAKEGGTQAILFETTLSIPAFKLALYQNYPNPFRPETLISFELPGAMNVELTVFDASGRKVATLLQGLKPAGLYKVPFRADGLASGVYFYKLKAGSRTFSRKMIIMR